MTPTVFAAVAAPSETVRMEMAWDAKDTEAKFRPFVAGRGARPRATVVDFSLRPSSPQDAPPIAMADLTESDRAKALAQIQGMVSTRDDGWFRFWPLRTVVVKPAPIAQSAGTSGLARVVLDVDGLAYGTPDAAASERARLNAEWGFAPVLKKFVDNPEALPLCLDPAPPAYTSPTRTLWTPARLPSGKAQFRFQVSRNDALRILPDHLEQAGLEPRTVDPRSIRLYSRGKEIPLLRFDNGDASFEPGESLVFYGEGSDSPYTTERAYWVVVGAESPGAPMPVNGPPPGAADLPHRPWQLARVRIEEDNALENRMGDFLSIREFRWVWATLRADKETSVTFSLPDLAEPDADWPESVPLKFDFFHSRPDQLPANAVPVSEREVLIEINGHSLERQRFRDDQDDEKEFQIPAALLKKNGNVARLRLASSSPGASPDRLDAGSFFDAVTVCYPRRPEAEDGRLLLSFQKEDRATTATFDLAGLAPDKPLAILDVTDPDAPRSIEPLRRNAQGVRIVVDADGGRKVLAARVDRLSSAPLFLNYTPSGLRDFSHQADFLIISHPEFLDLVKPLADLQARQGRLVETVNVLDIYDEFSMGELTPAAIKDFLWHAVTHWKVPPTYVLLVGDSSSDYRNETRYNVKVFVPTYRIALDNAEEIRACEHWYTTVLGADLYPDLILGRLSVNSREDAKRVVARVLAADQDLPLGPWRNRMTLVADDEVEFSQAADAFRKQAPESFFVDRVYLSQLPLERNFYIDPKFVEEEKLKVSTEATQAILDAFNRGSTFLAFWGHGSPNIWSDERIWFGGDSPNSDNLLLLNGPLLPFVANFTCDTGSIDYPKPSWNVCIAEDMMRAPNGGARGLYVPSGPGQTYEHQQLAAELSQALFHDRMERQGDAMALLSARFLTRHPSERDSNDQRLFRYIQMYELLGDPTTPFPQPRGACRLSVDPPAVEAGRVSVRASIAEAPFDAGKAVFRLEDPDGKSFGGETDEQRFDAQTGSFTLRLPPRPTPGLWTVKAYLWNDERRVDAAGAVEFPLDSRCAEIRDFHIEPGAPPRLSLRVANDSLLPIDALRFEIRETEGSKIAVIAADSLRLQPKEEKTWEKDWPTSFGLHPLSARLIDPGRSLRPEQTLATRKEIVWANPDPNGPLRFALSNNALTRAFRRLGSVAELEVQATAYLASGWFAGAVEVGAGLSGDVETSTTVRFAGGQASSSAPAILVLRAPAADLPKPFFVEVDPGRKIPGRDPARVRAFSSIDFSLLPDLAFDVSRGGGVAIDPEKPSDGHTIFFRVPIENKGAGPAGEFQVAAYDGDPTSGTRELANRAGPTYWSIPGLAAGARTEALLRWDPDKNAGDHKIYFKIDTLNHVLESNKNNNLSRVLLHVRTLARLETPRLEVDASGWARRQLRINASVHNAGESEARNVVFAFFGSLEPTPASKLGEILVHHVSPGETHAESYVWDVPPSFIAEGRKQDFSAQIYLKGSLQRISVFRSSYFPKSTPGR